MPKKVAAVAMKKRDAAIEKIAASAISSSVGKASVKRQLKQTIPAIDEPTTTKTPRKRRVPAALVTTLAAPPPQALTVPSPYRFPIDIDRMMTKVARVSGVAFVMLGALATLIYASLLLNGEASYFASIMGTSQSGQTIATATSTLTDPVGTVVNEIDSVANRLESFMIIDQQAPLRGTARVTVTTPQAHRVEIFMFTDSWQDKRSLGFATQVAGDRWVYAWDTTRVESGRNYRISAHVWDRSTYTTAGNADFVLQLEYMLVDNATAVVAPIETVVAAIVEEPPVTLSAPATLTGSSNVAVMVAGATNVSLIVEHETTGSRNYLYNATRVSPGEWRVAWQTAGFEDGEYRVTARVQNQYGSYVDGQLDVTLDNFDDAVAEEDEADASEEDTLTDVVVAAQVPTVPLTLPTLRLRLSSGAVLDGTERVEADMSTDAASHVYFYLRDPLSAIPRFVGAGIKTTGSNRWYTNWYTNNTPNGTYQLFARAITLPGPIDSPTVTVTIANAVVSEISEAATGETERITTAAATVADETETLKTPTERLVEDTTTKHEEQSAPAPTVQGAANALLLTYRETLDAELLRLGSAHRLKDEAAVSRIRVRITKLVDDMVARATYDDTEALKRELLSLVETMITTYLSEVDRVALLLSERKQSDILKDTDKDGISDFDEVTLYNTNPLVADSDNDGFTDGAEILAGFDPLSDVRESVIAYESPKESGIFREDLLAIDSIEAVAGATTTEEERVGIAFTGRALPNSFATLYIFSTPIVVTVKTDAEGSFAYRFDQELEDGQHNVYVGITDNAGRIVAKSQPFGFIKEAQAITPTQAAIVDNSVAAAGDDSLISGYAFAAVVSISVVAIGLVLILLGLQLDQRRRSALPDVATPSSV